MTGNANFANNAKAETDWQMLETSHRAGAGGTKAGSVGLRLNGGKAASDFVDKLTPGKYKQPPRPFERTVSESDTFKRQETPYNLCMMLPRNFCADCDRTNRPTDPLTAGGTINLNVFDQKDRLDLGIKLGTGGKMMQAVISFLCQECNMAYRAGINDPGKEIWQADVHGIQSTKTKNNAGRLVRIKANTEAYIKAMRLSGRDEIYVGERAC